VEIACISEFLKFLKPGNIPIKYFIFQNQVRQLENYKDIERLPPAARVAVDQGLGDTMSRGDRIAYIVVQGEIGAKLSDQVMPPSVLMEGKRPSMDYYMTKQIIPSVQRIFGPLANRAFSWLTQAKSMVRNGGTFQGKFAASDRKCFLCRAVTASYIFGFAKVPLFCPNCRSLPQAIAAFQKSINVAERRVVECQKICLNCTNGYSPNLCVDAYHCSVYFERFNAARDLISKYSDRLDF
jgi:hypothetical protein